MSDMSDMSNMSESESDQMTTSQAQQTLLAELAALRRTLAATKYRLPEALAARLRGDTREEIEADAAALARLIPPAIPAGASGETVGVPSTADRIRERIGGGRSPFFDPAFHKARHGGPLGATSDLED